MFVSSCYSTSVENCCIRGNEAQNDAHCSQDGATIGNRLCITEEKKKEEKKRKPTTSAASGENSLLEVRETLCYKEQ